MQRSIFFGDTPLRAIGLRPMTTINDTNLVLDQVSVRPIHLICRDENGGMFMLLSRKLLETPRFDGETTERLRRAGIDPGQQHIVTMLALALYEDRCPTGSAFRLAFFDRLSGEAQYLVLSPEEFVSLMFGDLERRVALA